MSPDGSSPRRDRDQWLGIELRHLVTLGAIARHGSFSAAASSLGYVQSAISQQIASLEGIVGARLVERSPGPGPVVLTEAGQVLLTHAEEILDRLHEARDELAERLRPTPAGLSVAVHAEARADLFPPVVGALRTRLPDVDIVVHGPPTADELYAGVESGSFDFGFAPSPPDAGQFAVEQLFRAPYVLLAPAPAGRRPPERILAELPLIAGRGSGALEALEARLQQLGVEPRCVLQTDNQVGVKGLVVAGKACALVPRVAVDGASSDVAVVALDGLLEPRAFALVWQRRRQLCPLRRAFVQAAQQVCTELAGRD